MGYDVFIGASFEDSELALTIDSRVFDAFVEESQRASPPFRMVVRINDEYGDADFKVDDVGALARELLELEKMGVRPSVLPVCQALRRIAQAAHARKVAIFCRGD